MCDFVLPPLEIELLIPLVEKSLQNFVCAPRTNNREVWEQHHVHNVWATSLQSPTLAHQRHRMLKQSRKELYSQMQHTRAATEGFRRELELMTNSEDMDVFIVKQFIVQCFRGRERSMVRRHVMFAHDSLRFSWLEELFHWASLKIGSKSMPFWLLVTFINITQDIFVVQPCRALLSVTRFDWVTRSELTRIVHAMRTRFETIINRRRGVMRDSHSLIHHFNPACRVARMFPALPTSRLLMCMNDFDVPVFHVRPPTALHVMCWNALPLWLQDLCVDALLAVFANLILLAFYVFGEFSPLGSALLAVGVLLVLFLSDSETFKRQVAPKTFRFFAGPARPLRAKMHSYIVTASNTQLTGSGKKKTTHRTQFQEASDETVQESKQQPLRERGYSADNDSITTSPSITGAHHIRSYSHSEKSRRQQEIFELKTRSIQIKPLMHKSSDYFHNSQIHENYNFDPELLASGSRLTRPNTQQQQFNNSPSPGGQGQTGYDPFMSQMTMGTANFGGGNFTPQKSQESVGFPSPTPTPGSRNGLLQPLNLFEGGLSNEDGDVDGDEVRDSHPAETQWNARRQAALKSHRRSNRFAHEVQRNNRSPAHNSVAAGYASPGNSTVQSGYYDRSRGGSISDDLSLGDSTVLSDNASNSDIHSVNTRYQRRRNKNRHRDVDLGPGSTTSSARGGGNQTVPYFHEGHQSVTGRMINQPYIDNIGDVNSNMSRLVLAADNNYQAPLPVIDIFGAIDSDRGQGPGERGGGSSVTSSARGGRAVNHRRPTAGEDSSRRSSESSNNRGPGYH
eukprot:gene22540-28672_t